MALLACDWKRYCIANKRMSHTTALIGQGVLPAYTMASCENLLGITRGRLGITPCRLGITRGRFGITPCRLCITPCSFGITPCRFCITPYPLGITPCRLGITRGRFGITPCRLGITPCRLGITHGRFGLRQNCPTVMPMQTFLKRAHSFNPCSNSERAFLSHGRKFTALSPLFAKVAHAARSIRKTYAVYSTSRE